MSMEYSGTVFKQIKNLVIKLTKFNYNNNRNEIFKLLGPLGFNGYKYLLSFLIDNINFQNRVEKDEYLIILLKELFFDIKDSDYFSSLMVELFNSTLKPKNSVINFILGELNLDLTTIVLLSLSLLNDDSLRSLSVKLIKSKLKDILKIGPVSFSPPLIHSFLYFIRSSTEFEKEKKEILQKFEKQHRDNLHLTPLFPFNPKTKKEENKIIKKGNIIDRKSESTIVGVLREIGYNSCAKKEILSIIFDVVGEEINIQVIARIIGMMANSLVGLVTSLDGLKSFLMSCGKKVDLTKFMKTDKWNISIFVEVLKEKFPKINLKEVLYYFDYPSFKVKDIRSLTFINRFFQLVANVGVISCDFILGDLWKNVEAQLKLIIFAVESSQMLVTFNVPNVRKVNVKQIDNLVEFDTLSCWYCLDLIETLLQISCIPNYYKSVKIFLNGQPKDDLTLLYVGLIQCNPKLDDLRLELIAKIITEFMNPNTSIKNALIVMRHGRNIRKAWFLNYLINLWKSNPKKNLERVCDVSLETGDIKILLEGKHYLLALGCVILTGRKDTLKINSWFDLKMKMSNPDIKEIVDRTLEFIVSSAEDYEKVGLPAPLTKQEFSVLFSSLSKLDDNEIKAKVLEVFQSFEPGLQPKIMDSSQQQFTISPDVEDWSTQFFKSIFEQRITIDSAIVILHQLRASKSKRDQAKYACVVHNLFDEYRFFHQYPDNELKIVAEFFGDIIKSHIITGKTLNYALYYILKALNSHNEKMYQFGMIAVVKFVDRLSEWPQFIDYLKNIPRLLKDSPEIWMKISPNKTNDESNVQLEFAIPKDDTIKSRHGSVSGKKKKVTKSSVDDNLSTLQKYVRTEKFTRPPTEIIEKFQFLLNNLTLENINIKFTQFIDILKQPYITFFLLQIITERVVTQPKFLEIYVVLMEKLENPFLLKETMRISYNCIRAMFASDLINKEIDERGLLKNLGRWLGLLTIGRSHPILHRDLSLKKLLYSAYETGKLIAAVPFVCRIIECCIISKILKPPNPWILSILSLLAEIHKIQDLKLNIKFDVEMLCKKLGILLADIEIRGYLKDKTIFNIVNNPDLRKPVAINAHDKEFDMNRLTTLPEIIYEELSEKVVINPALDMFTKQPELKQLVVYSLDQAIREIIQPVVKRSVQIASRTAVELVLKDFSAEKSIQKFQRAAHLMVQSLSASLAMVTSKDPLRVSMENHLKTFLNSVLVVELTKELERKIEESCQTICQDNIHLGSSFVEKEAMEKATLEINRQLSAEVNQRKKFIHSQGAVPWTNYHMMYQDYLPSIPILPEVLNPPENVGELQTMVYEQFSKMMKESRSKNMESSSISQTISQINEILQKIESISKDRDNNIVMKLITTIINTIKKSPNKFIVSGQICRIILIKFYQGGDNYINDVFMFIIKKIFEDSEEDEMKDHVFSFWIDLENSKRFSNETINLINNNLLPINDVDKEISSLLVKSSNSELINFSLKIIRESVVTSHSISINQIPKIFSSLCKQMIILSSSQQLLLKKFFKKKKLVNHHHHHHHHRSVSKFSNFNTKEILQIKKVVCSHFNNWVGLYKQVLNENQFPLSQQLTSFVTSQLQQEGLLKTDTDFKNIVRILVVYSIEYFNRNMNNNKRFEFADGFTGLITVILRMSTSQNRVSLLNCCLEIIVEHLLESHEKEIKNFQQRIYLRIVSNLMISMSNEKTKIVEILTAFSKLLNSVQPLKTPGFIFSWLELVSHRRFMPRLLMSENKILFMEFHGLLISLFKFLEPYLEKSQLTPSIKVVYKGTLKILLVLLHDFSEFLCVFHFSLCDVIPNTCIQMRNLILSAFPRHMKLPDPFTSNLKVDLLPEINQPPEILSDYTYVLKQYKLIHLLEEFLHDKKRLSAIFFKEFKHKLIQNRKYNVSLMNSLVLHIGVSAINDIQINNKSNIVDSPAMEVFLELSQKLDYEGRYHFFNAMANQLRYPNNQTHYFSRVVLYLFGHVELQNDKEIIQEQITRVLLERLIVNRPHPWGLLITFIELVKNPTYNFWNKEFIHCAPSIEKLFRNVGKSCINRNNT